MRKPCVLFASWHFYLDNSNGASISARELLLGLLARGWSVKTLCGPFVDNYGVADVNKVLRLRGVCPKIEIEEKSQAAFTVVSFKDSGISSVVFRPNDVSFIPGQASGKAFISLFAASLEKIKPDIILTYGGSWVAAKCLRIARKMGVKSVFLLQNFAYRDAGLFRFVDKIIVPSQYASNVYKKRLGIESTPISPLIGKEKICFDETVDSNTKKYVLYVNPSASKGAFLFVEIARELWKKRPDIPFLVVEGCSTSKSLLAAGANLNGVRNISLMANTNRPSDFYRHAKITLVPSLVEESFGRVAAESTMAGVPVISSNRGALSETVGTAGTLLEISPRLQPDTRTFPNSNDVAPWLNEIVKLWDNSEYYEK